MFLRWTIDHAQEQLKPDNEKNIGNIKTLD